MSEQHHREDTYHPVAGVRGQVDHQFGSCLPACLACVFLGCQHGGGVQHADVVHVAPRRLGQEALTPHAVGEIALPRKGTAALPIPPSFSFSSSGRQPELLAGREYGQVAS